MMGNKHEQLVMSLLNFDRYLDAKCIARKLEISEKTVRRSIQKLNANFLNQYGLKLKI